MLPPAVDPTPVVKSFATRASPEMILLALVLGGIGWLIHDLSESVDRLTVVVSELGAQQRAFVEAAMRQLGR